MNSPSKLPHYDITFIGHVCYDEVTPFGGETRVSPGSAVLCGAMVAPRVGAKTAAITRVNPADEEILAPLRTLGVDLYVTPSPVTTFARVVHFSENVDERRLYVTRDPGPFTLNDLPAGLATGIIHLAGISDHEFTVDFIRNLHRVGYALSLDMQSFVRVIGPDREIIFSDFPAKREVVSLLDVVKLDVVEAEILTGTRDLAAAAMIFADWGAREVLITEKSGATLAVDGTIHQETFTNRSVIGRTGRGDTTISAYLARRTTHGPADALRFAAALVSLKMETPGPFTGTLEEVERRMAGDRNR
ncbi:MAG: carbohydrate kinase family protein [Armatimonadota bacterium]